MISDIAIVIVNWNSGEFLESCVDSILMCFDEARCRVVVVDNASTDGSLAAIEARDELIVIKLDENVGFARACNIGAGVGGDAEFILFLNPDAAISSDTLKQVVAYMRSAQARTVGICGVALVDAAGEVSRSCSRFPTLSRLVSSALGVDRFFPKLGTTMRDWPHDEVRLVDQVIGAFFFVRQSVFKQLGGFDERFFVYYEEVDFSYRAKQCGWDSFFLGSVRAFHAGCGSSDVVKARRFFYSSRSKLIYSRKHFSFPSFLVILLATLFVEPSLRVSYGVLSNSAMSSKEVLRGSAMLWSWFPRWVFRGETR
jgi:GT2 family glycosyltransferase